MIDGGVEIMELPAISTFLELLYEHAGDEASKGQWGFYPGAKGEILTKEKADQVKGSERWIGKPVFDANALVETYTGMLREGSAADRIRIQYEEWCYGHVGEEITKMVQLPGGAVFKKDGSGNFTDVAYLYRKYGDAPLDWEIFVCNDPEKGLHLQRMDAAWSCWGLISMIMRYDLHGPVTEGLPLLSPGVPYAVVGSSVLNFRKAPTEELITSLPNGTAVRLTGRTEGDWTEVIVGETKGFCFSKFLEKHLEG